MHSNSILHCFAGIEDLCAKRDELHKQILLEDEEKMKIQNDISILTERLARINESLARKIQMRNDFDKTIAETEGAYNKVGSYDDVCRDIVIIDNRSWRVHRLYYTFLREKLVI